jgi:hypothetical protein
MPARSDLVLERQHHRNFLRIRHTAEYAPFAPAGKAEGSALIRRSTPVIPLPRDRTAG